MRVTDCQAIAWYAIQGRWADQYFTNAELCDATGLSLGD